MARKLKQFHGGLVGGTFKPFSQEEISKIHSASMEVFEKQGCKLIAKRH